MDLRGGNRKWSSQKLFAINNPSSRDFSGHHPLSYSFKKAEICFFFLIVFGDKGQILKLPKFGVGRSHTN